MEYLAIPCFFRTFAATKEQIITMATITIDTDKLNAKLDYYTNGFYGISISYDGKVIKKLDK